MNRTLAMYALLAGSLVYFVSPAHPQSVGDPGLDVRMKVSGNYFSYTVANAGSKAVAAYAVKVSFPQTNQERILTWDSVLADDPALDPDAHMVGGIGHIESRPYPDRVEVVAGIWSDGETFGEEVYVKQLLDARQERASDLERVAKLAQRGLDENWAVEQYLNALDGMSKSFAVDFLRSFLKNNPRPAEHPEALRHLVTGVFDRFTGNYERIRRAKPVTTAATNP